MKNINIVIKKSIMARILSCLFVEIFIITQLFALAPMDRLTAGDTSILEILSLRRVRGAESIDVASEVLGWIDSPIGQYSFYYAILNEGQQQEYRDVVNRVAPLLSSNTLFQIRSLEAQALIFWAIWDIGRSRVISPESIAQSLLGAVAEGEAAGDALRSDPAYYTLDPAGRREFEGLAKLSFTERIEDLRVNQEVSLMEGVADVLKAIPLNVMQNIRNTMSAHPLAAGISLDLLITAALTLPFAFGLNWAIGSTGLQAFLTAIAGISALPRAELIVAKYMSKLFTTPNYLSGVKPGTYLTDKAILVFPGAGMPAGIKETIAGNPGMPFVILTYEGNGKAKDVEKFIADNREFLEANNTEVIHMRIPVQYWFKRGNLNDMAQFVVNYLTPSKKGEQTGYRSEKEADQAMLTTISGSGEDNFNGIDINQIVAGNTAAKNNAERTAAVNLEYYRVGENGLTEVAEIDNAEYKMIQEELNKFTNEAGNSQADQSRYWVNFLRKIAGKQQYQVFPRVIRTDWQIVGDSVVAQDWMLWEATNGEKYLIKRTKVALDQIVGDISKLADRKYRFVMDQDNTVPAGVAMKMLQILEDPLNQPVVENGRVVRGMAGLGSPVMVQNPGESSWAEFGSRGRFVGIPYMVGYSDWFGSAFSTGKLLENMEVGEDLQRGLANRSMLSEDIIVASLLNLGFTRTDADLLLKYVRSVNPPEIEGDMPQTLMYLMEGDVPDFVQGLARQVRWDQGDIYNFLFGALPFGSLNQEGQWENTPIPGHIKWHMFMNVVGMSLDLTLPLFVGTWLLSQLGNVPQVVIGDNALMLSHFALTMGSLYYLFHFPKKDVTGLASTAQDMGRSQILLQNIVERIPSGFRHLLGAFRGETINWNTYGQASTGLTNSQMIDKLKKTWLIGSAAALGMTFLAPTLWPVTFGLPLLGSLIASPFLIHTMGRAEEGILDVIKTVKGLGGDYAKVLDTLETVNYPNGLSNRLVQIMQQWNQKRIVYETEYNLIPEEYTLGIEEDAAFMTDAWSILTETERAGLIQAYGGNYETAKINFFETIAQAFVDKAKISDGYDIQEAVVSSLTSSNTQYKKLYGAFVNGVTMQKTLRSGETKNVKNEGAKGEKMANFLDVLTTASDPWRALNKTEKTIVIKSQGGADLSDEDAAALFNSFIADISQGRDDEILRSADTLISNLNIPIDTLTGYLMQAAPHIFNGTELTQEEATAVTKRMVYSMYLDGVLNNFEDEFEKLLTYSSAFEEYNVWEQNNPDATLDAQLTQLNAILDRIPR